MDGKALTAWLGLPRWYFRRWLRQLSWPWLVSGVLFAGCAGVYFAVLEPVRHELMASHLKLASMQRQAKLVQRPPVLSQQDNMALRLAAFYRYFPAGRSLPDWLEKIQQAAADNDLSLIQGEYRIDRDKYGKLMHCQVTLPVKGTYPHIRGFVAGVLSGVPVASLDSVKFERQKIGDHSVEAMIILTLHLGRES